LSQEVWSATSSVEAEAVVKEEAMRMQTELSSFAEHQLRQSHLQYLTENAMNKQQHDIVCGEQRDQITILVEEVRDLQKVRVAEAVVVEENSVQRISALGSKKLASSTSMSNILSCTTTLRRCRIALLFYPNLKIMVLNIFITILAMTCFRRSLPRTSMNFYARAL
jgi:hypothetical protein